MNWTAKELEKMRKRALSAFAELREQFKAAAGNAETTGEKEYAQFVQDIENAQSFYEAGNKPKTLETMNTLKDTFDHRASGLKASVKNGFFDKFSIARYKTLRKAEKFKDYKGRIKGMLFDIGFSIKQPTAAAL